MRNVIRFFIPDGSEPHTQRVEAANIGTHIAAHDDRAYEAALLAEFTRADGIPGDLDNGRWVLREEHADSADYERVEPEV